MISVLHAEEYPRPDFNQTINTTVRLLDICNLTFGGRSRIFVDGANPPFIRLLKERIDENVNYEQQIVFYKKSYVSV